MFFSEMLTEIFTKGIMYAAFVLIMFTIIILMKELSGYKSKFLLSYNYHFRKFDDSLLYYNILNMLVTQDQITKNKNGFLPLCF